MITTENVAPPPLRRALEGTTAAGVAEGLARHFDLDVLCVRIAIVVLALMGPGILLYIVGWLLIPEEGADHPVLSELIERAWPA